MAAALVIAGACVGPIAADAPSEDDSLHAGPIQTSSGSAVPGPDAQDTTPNRDGPGIAGESVAPSSAGDGSAANGSTNPQTDKSQADDVPNDAVADDSGDQRRARLVIHATGDVSLDPAYLPVFATEGYDHAFSGLGGMFLDDSLTIINLECPVSSQGSPLDKEFTFRCAPEALADARNAGVDVANLANNHILDFGQAAARDTLTHLADAGIAGVGIGESAEEAARPAFFELDGWTVAVVGFGGVVPSTTWLADDGRFGMADGDDAASMAATVASAAEHADIVIVTVHWGVELDTEPRPDDVVRAEAMIAAGADMIFGHHSHRLNPLTIVDGTPVAWGLGNFVWPSLSVAGSTTAVARVVVEPDGSVTACLIPATIETHGHPVLDAPPQPGCHPD